MPREIYPSSYECDCGHQLNFCENTVREMKQMSMKKRVSLGEGSDHHAVVFEGGQMVEVFCPLKSRDGTGTTPSEGTPGKKVAGAKATRKKPGTPAGKVSVGKGARAGAKQSPPAGKRTAAGRGSAGRGSAGRGAASGKVPRPEDDAAREERITMEAVVDAHDAEERAMGWYYYLEDKLTFPFTARCAAKRAVSPLRVGDEVDVVGMPPESECEREMYVTIRWEKDGLAVPLSQLEVIDGEDPTREAVEDWNYWVRKGYEF